MKAPHDSLVQEYTAREEGYIYAYVSNENPTFVEVYFDDVTVTHAKSNLIQANEYYPFGMQTANSWTRENTTGNNFLGNAGTELNTTTSVYDLDYRNFDPVLGRMNQIDPMSDVFGSHSPYQYSFNSPVLFNDRNGAVPVNGVDDARASFVEAYLVALDGAGGGISNMTSSMWGAMVSDLYAYKRGDISFYDYTSKYGGITYTNDGNWTTVSMLNRSTEDKDVEQEGGMMGTLVFKSEWVNNWQVNVGPVLPGMDPKGVKSVKDGLDVAGYYSGALAATQGTLLAYRNSIPLDVKINAKIATFSNFSNVYKELGVVSRVAGKAGTAGTILGIVVDANLYAKDQISGARFGYRLGGALSSILIGAKLGASAGPWGVAGGAVFGLGVTAGEMAYDGANYIGTELKNGFANAENALSTGRWMPGKK